MSDTNTITISGNIKKNPERFTTQKGRTVEKFDVISQYSSYPGGKLKTSTIRCTNWNIREEIKAGDHVVIRGTLDSRDFTSRQSGKQYTFMEVNCNELHREMTAPKLAMNEVQTDDFPDDLPF